MSNAILNKGTSIMLDKERYVNLDMNALIELEDKFGNIDKAFSAISKNPKMKDIRYILYLSLRHEDEQLTESQVGSLVSLGNLGEVLEVLGSSMSDSLPEPTNVNGKN